MFCHHVTNISRSSHMYALHGVAPNGHPLEFPLERFILFNSIQFYLYSAKTITLSQGSLIVSRRFILSSLTYFILSSLTYYSALNHYTMLWHQNNWNHNNNNNNNNNNNDYSLLNQLLRRSFISYHSHSVVTNHINVCLVMPPYLLVFVSFVTRHIIVMTS